MMKKEFYKSSEWRQLRYLVLREQPRVCALCGRGKSHNLSLHVDHIRPRSQHPELELDIENLQILCEDCNFGKSNKYADDWRDKVLTMPAIEGLTYPVGGKYVGELKSGMRHGQGKYTWPDGCVYEGGWVAGERKGYGHMTYSDQHIFNEDEADDWNDYAHTNDDGTRSRYDLDGEEQILYEPRRYQWLPSHEFFNEGIYKGEWDNDTRHGLGEFSTVSFGKVIKVWSGKWTENDLNVHAGAIGSESRWIYPEHRDPESWELNDDDVAW